MTEKMSNSRLKKLGTRIADSLPSPDPSDLDLLDEYRAHIDSHLREVEAIVARECSDVVTRIKTHATLFDKLAKLDLGKIQDIGGARCVVVDREAQDRLSEAFCAALPVERMVDRRADPRCGYRAIHLVVEFPDRCPIEVQIRTEWQHEWAQRFEQLADLWGRQIRYGELPNEPDAPCQFGTRLDCVRHMLEISDGFDTLERKPTFSSVNNDLRGEADLLARARSLFDWIAEQAR